MKYFSFLLICFYCLAFTAHANVWWHVVDAKSTSNSQNKPAGVYFSADHQALRNLFNQPVSEQTITLPMPDGTQHPVTLIETRVMSPALAQKFPSIKTYRGGLVGSKEKNGRFTLSQRGLDGMLRYQDSWVFISYDIHLGHHISYFARDDLSRPQPLRSEVLTDAPQKNLPSRRKGFSLARKSSGDQIRTYRLAISAASEYTRVNGGRSGTIVELVNLVNRINEILLVDLSVQFELVDNNDQLIFDSADTDPFENDGDADLDINQETIDNLIGAQNYDIGHLVNTNPGGLAVINAVCVNNFKAKGYSGSFTSGVSGERFYIDLVAHEFGHQLGARHTWNAQNEGSCTDDQRSPLSAVEPGSGSTIMAYAGLCGTQDLQTDSDPYFHAFSIDQIRDNIDNASGGSCGTLSSSNTGIPVISIQQSRFAIPANTPFVLRATATDPDGDALTFAWEQVNPGGNSGGTASRFEMRQDSGSNPLFRSFAPVDSPVRYFPRLNDVLSDRVTNGEVYPTQARVLNFELVARDGRGAVDREQVEIEVVNSDGFAVSEPRGNTTLNGGRDLTVIWDTAGTETAPVSCTQVDVMLDINGTNSFDIALAEAVPNTGEAVVTLTNSDIAEARLMVRCTNNVFYAVNPQNFAISANNNPQAPIITGQVSITISEDTDYNVTVQDLVIDDPDTPFPGGFTLTLNSPENATLSGNRVIPNADFNGTVNVEVIVNDGSADSNSFPLAIAVTPVNDAPVASADSFTVEQDSADNTLDVLSNDTDVEDEDLQLTSTDYAGDGTVEIANNVLIYSPAAGFTGSEVFRYTVADSEGASASSQVTVTVEAPAPPTPAPAPTPAPDSSGSSGGSFGWLILLILFTLSTYRVSLRSIT